MSEIHEASISEKLRDFTDSSSFLRRDENLQLLNFLNNQLENPSEELQEIYTILKSRLETIDVYLSHKLFRNMLAFTFIHLGIVYTSKQAALSEFITQPNGSSAIAMLISFSLVIPFIMAFLLTEYQYKRDESVRIVELFRRYINGQLNKEDQRYLLKIASWSSQASPNLEQYIRFFSET